MADVTEVTIENIEKSMKTFKYVTELLQGANDLLRDVLQEDDVSNHLRKAIIEWKKKALEVSSNIQKDFGVS